MYEFPEPIESTYEFSETFSNPRGGKETVTIKLKIDNKNKKFALYNDRDQLGFYFNTSKYAYRWEHILNLMKQATRTANTILLKYETIE